MIYVGEKQGVSYFYFLTLEVYVLLKLLIQTGVAGHIYPCQTKEKKAECVTTVLLTFHV